MKRIKFIFALLVFFGWTALSIPSAGQEPSSSKEDPPKAVKVGDMAPDFELKSLGDKKVKLSDRFGKRPVILLFSRASW